MGSDMFKVQIKYIVMFPCGSFIVRHSWIAELTPEMKSIPAPEIDPAVKKKWDSIFINVQALLKAIVHTVPM